MNMNIFRTIVGVTVALLCLGCGSKKPRIWQDGRRLSESEVAKLTISDKTVVHDFDGAIYHGGSKAKNWWVSPGKRSIGVKYQKIRRGTTFKDGKQYTKTTTEYTPKVQYVEHNFESGKKYFLILERDGMAVNPAIREDLSRMRSYCKVHKKFKKENEDYCFGYWLKEVINKEENIEQCAFEKKYFKDKAQSREDRSESMSRKWRWKNQPIRTFLKALGPN